MAFSATPTSFNPYGGLSPVMCDNQGFLQPGLFQAIAPKSAVTQGTSVTTAVTCDAYAGRITTFAALAAGAGVSFQVNNKYVSASSVVVATVEATTATADATRDAITVDLEVTGAGSFTVHIYNGDALITAAAPIVNFIVAA